MELTLYYASLLIRCFTEAFNFFVLKHSYALVQNQVLVIFVQLECAKYDRNTMQFFERYRINIGEDTLPIIVSSLDLYRLHRVIEKKQRNRHQSSARYEWQN